ncbi:hypothetical protein [Staphylococcus gallinarum]|uniref:hypothetical protein n=1 Tax=Staphylococcus gallinarum TaxID=1293 RepID=UPI0030C3A7B6
MAYEYEKENISKVNHFNIVTGSNNVSKPSEELKEVYRKAKAWDLLKVELKRKLDMESERLRRANRNLEDDDSKEYIIGKITGQNVELMNIMTTISDLERADDER